MGDRLTQARAEAERIRCYGNKSWAPAMQELMRDSFVQGVEWADANPKPHTITRERWERACDGAFRDLGRLGRERFDWFEEALGIVVTDE